MKNQRKLPQETSQQVKKNFPSMNPYFSKPPPSSKVLSVFVKVFPPFIPNNLL